MVSQHKRFDSPSKTYLDTHPIQVIQSINESLQVATGSHLVGGEVMFKEGAINVIVGRVAVDEAIEEKSVERKAPVLGGGIEFVVLPHTGVLEWVDGVLVRVQIVVDITFIVTIGSASGEAEGKSDCEPQPHLGRCKSKCKCKCNGQDTNEWIEVKGALEQTNETRRKSSPSTLLN